MYIRNAPVEFRKDGETRFVYYTVEADELIDQGWVCMLTQEERIAEQTEDDFVPIESKEEQVVPAEDVAVNTDSDGSKLVEMTKNQLIEYASENGVTINPYSTKAEILSVCMESLNG
jgi:hypothetical protein